MSALTRETLEADVRVFSAGDAGSCAYVIEEGCVEVLREHNGDLRRIAVLSKGAMFGEVALLDQQTRTATVRTLVPTRLQRIDRNDIAPLLADADPVIQHLLNLLLSRFRHANALLPAVGPEALAVEAEDAGDEDIRTRALRSLSLNSDLGAAIAGDQMLVFYQPLVDLKHGGVVGVEALVRWAHPQLGLLNPTEFIPIAERTGTIQQLGRWVLDRACGDYPALRALARPADQADFHVSVNLAAPELCSDGVVELVREVLAAHRLAATALRIELTETCVIADRERVEAALTALRADGVSIALDDFGSGYAGLDYLRTLPFSCIKIDLRFVQQLADSDRSYQIVQSALTLARALGLSAVAEGIEDAATAERLRELGCDVGQGYLYSRPVPLAELDAWARSR